MPTQETLRYERHKWKPPRQSIYNPICGQTHNHPRFNVPPEKTPHKAAVGVVAVTAEEVAEEEEEIPLAQEDPLQATQVVGAVKTDSSDNPRMFSWETAPRQRSSSRNGNYITT